ncbi:MAG: alpha/beta hydrolase [Candidatus Sericytochromatia bacterium]|nr:alpha/beta hydrolase [Candidatus Sericytochromatia bacterium]
MKDNISSTTPHNFPCFGTSNYVKLRGLNFHYLSWGDINKPLIIMLHGFMDHSHTFDLLAFNLMNDYQIIAWDARGFGRTEWIHPSGYYHFFDYLYDLELFIDYLNAENVTIIGHSMGGIIATLYAGTFPEKVNNLVNIEGWFINESSFNDAPTRAKRWIEEVKNIKDSKSIKDLEDASLRLRRVDNLMSIDVSEHLAYEGTKKEFDNLYWRYDNLHRTRAPQQTYIKQIESFWKNITCPVLFLKGEKSNFDLSGSQQLSNSFNNMKYVEVKESGHNLHLHQPIQVSKIIDTFLSSNEN